jgi:thiamine pyrophosphate-dependent acetolactate synthase large subunit-like protein
MPIAAEIVISGLAQGGIDNIFGLPGGETVEILDSIRHSEVEFTFVHLPYVHQLNPSSDSCSMK